MWRKLWNDGRRIDIMSASVDEAYAPDEPIMIGISSVEIFKFRTDVSSSLSSEKMESISAVIKKEEETEDCRTDVFHEESCAEIIKHER